MSNFEKDWAPGKILWTRVVTDARVCMCVFVYASMYMQVCSMSCNGHTWFLLVFWQTNCNVQTKDQRTATNVKSPNFYRLRPCAFFSMFLVTRPRSFWLKTKKKKIWGSQNQSCWPSVSCAQHLHVALADSIEWTSQFLHGYCDEEEELSPYP